MIRPLQGRGQSLPPDMSRVRINDRHFNERSGEATGDKSSFDVVSEYLKGLSQEVVATLDDQFTLTRAFYQSGAHTSVFNASPKEAVSRFLSPADTQKVDHEYQVNRLRLETSNRDRALAHVEELSREELEQAVTRTAEERDDVCVRVQAGNDELLETVLKEQDERRANDHKRCQHLKYV